MATDHLSLQITTCCPCSVKKYSSSISSSPQIFFHLVYDVQHKIGDDKVLLSRRIKALSDPFESTIKSWNGNPNAACRNLLHKFDLLGIDSRHHVELLLLIMESINKIMESGVPLAFLQYNAMFLEIKVINIKTYSSLKFLKREQGIKVCSICLEDVGANGASTTCGHVFHCDCITKWLDKGENCPLCRSMMSRYTIYGPVELSRPS